MKKKLSKIEIATYLRDYSNLMIYASLNPNQNLFELFKKMLEDENRGMYSIKEYYFDMISIYKFFLLNKFYSFISDKLFDFLTEESLSELTIPQNIFIDKNDANRFSKKQIIKFIRNAINHNNYDDKQLYEIYNDNGEIKIEFFLKNTKPIPFHIEMNIYEYVNIMSGLRNSTKIDLVNYKSTSSLNFDNLNLKEELDKIFYRRYYFKRKPESEVAKNIFSLVEQNRNPNILIENLDDSIITYIDYPLSIPQKLLILEQFNKWKKILGMDEQYSFSYILHNIVPLGIQKVNLISFSLIIAESYAKSCKNNFEDIIEDAIKLKFNSKDTKNPLYYFKDENDDFNFILRAYDFDSIVAFTMSVYYGYLYDTLITDETIKIGENNYVRNNIRNSFVHGRWFIGVNNCFKLYDCDNGDINELNYNWRASIPLVNILNSAEEQYQNALKEMKNDFFLYYPISISVDENKKPISIMLIKNDKNYIFNIDIDSYNDEFIPWGLYIKEGNHSYFVEDTKEINFFFKELEESLLKENEKYSYLLTFLKEKNKLAISYKYGEISLEKLKLKDDLFLPLLTNEFDIREEKKLKSKEIIKK